MTKPELTKEQMNALPESTPLEVMKAIVDNGGPVWAVVWDCDGRRLIQCAHAVSVSRDELFPFVANNSWKHAALIPAVLPETVRPMTWGDAWDMGLWIFSGGPVSHSHAYVHRLDTRIDVDQKYSTSHRGPWYPPVMPVGRTMTGVEWMEWSAKRGEG
jgi:hypothetical protein